MTAVRPPFRLAIAGVAIAALAAFSVPAGSTRSRTEIVRRHVRLVKSSPAADGTVAGSPTSVKLWFSERVEVSLSRVKLVSAEGTTIPTGKASSIPGETDAAFMTAVRAPLPAGVYTVTWVTASDDGHPMKGVYRFVVGQTP